MILRRWLLASVMLVVVAGCSAPPPTASSSPIVLTPTSAPQTLAPTPAESPTPGIAPLSVSCAGPGGTPLAATFYGAGTTAVIFSNRSDKGQSSWATVAGQTALAGYLAITYDYRGHNADNSEDINKLNEADLDLGSMVACVKQHGAQAIVLVGASIGGMASAKVAAAAPAAALVVIGSPMSHPDLKIHVNASELQNAIPKLFIAAEHDPLVAAADTQAMFQAAAEPKTFYQYASDAHGTDLLLGPFAQDFQQRLLDFISANAPSHP